MTGDEITVGGRVNVDLRGSRIAFDRRSRDGWFEVYVADLDGRNEENLTAEISFDWPGVRRRHVGLPTWSPDGSHLLLSVEEVDPDAPASMSNDSANHVSMQPGRGVANSIALFRLRDRKWWWVWRYGLNTRSKGSMHCYLSNDSRRVAFSRMVSYDGTFATWDLGVADMVRDGRGQPALINLRYWDPVTEAGNTLTAPLNEMNGWHPTEDSLIGLSCNPLPGQQQIYDDVASYDVESHELVRQTQSSGLNGEPRRYCEHIVWRPDGRQFAYMATPEPHRGNPDGQGTEVMVCDGEQTWQASFFNDPDHPMYVPPQNGSTKTTAARPSWVKSGRGDWSLMTTALCYPDDDGQNGGQGPIIQFSASQLI